MTWIHEAVTNMMMHIHPAFSSAKKREALQLEQFRNFDFASMSAEVTNVFKNAEEIKLRFVPLAYRISLDGARQYAKNPRREFDGVGEAQAIAWEALYRELRVDRFLRKCEQAGVLQQSYIVGYWPDDKGKMALHRFLPFQVVEVKVTNPMWSGNIADAAKVVLARSLPNPNGLTGSTLMPWVMHIELTADEAWARLPDGQRFGLFAPDGRNPTGRIPLAMTNRADTVDTADDMVLPPIAQDVLSCQIGINLILSDGEATMRSQNRVKVLVTGEDADSMPKEMPDTAGSWLVLPGDVQGTPLTLNPPFEKYLRAGETTLYYLSQFRYLRPEAYQASIVTGAARRADAEGFLEESDRQEGRCMELEEDVLKLIFDVEQKRPRALRLQEPRLRVEYRYVETPENALQKQQALSVQIANLMNSHVEQVARDAGISEREARKLLERRAKERLVKPLSSATPGIDKTADNVSIQPTSEVTP